MNDVQPAAYLAVLPPAANLGRRGAIPARLARNLAVLFGVDVPDNPTGTTWVGDYSSTNLVDIGRGAPTPRRGEQFTLPVDERPTGSASVYVLANRAVQQLKSTSRQDDTAIVGRRIGDLDVLPPATINEYGPDTKAATVLVGANVLFDTLRPVFDHVIPLLCTHDEGDVPDLTRAIVWAVLVGEVFRCQPALFAAAVQARGVQRILTRTAHLTQDDGLEDTAASNEVGGRSDPWPHRPTSLRLVDETLSLPDLETGLRQRALRSMDTTEALPEPGLLALRRLVDRRIETLFRDPRGAILHVVENETGRRRVHAYVPALSSFVEEAVLGDLRTPRPRDVPGRDPSDTTTPVWDFSSPDQFDALVPYLPRVVDLRRLADHPQAAVASVLTHLEVLHTLRNLSLRGSDDDPTKPAVPEAWIRERLPGHVARVVETAEAFFGPEHGVTALCRATDSCLRLRNVGDTDPDLLGVIEQALTDLNAVRRHVAAGSIGPEQLTRFWVSNSSNFTGATRRVRPAAPERARDLFAVYDELWEETRPFWSGSDAAAHNHFGSAVRDGDLPTVRRALVEGFAVLEHRRAAEHVTTSGIQRTVQLLIRGMCRVVGSTPEDDQWWPRLRACLTSLLEAPRVVTMTGTERPLERIDVPAAVALVDGSMAEVRHWPAPTLGVEGVRSLVERLAAFVDENPDGIRTVPHAELQELVHRARATFGATPATQTSESQTSESQTPESQTPDA